VDVPTVTVRQACGGDVDALVRLRLSTAAWHVRLDPASYRLPDERAVRRHFENRLAVTSDGSLLVAECAGHPVGMAEVELLPEPPDHLIRVDRRRGTVHTVVLGPGPAGTALLAAAERWAAERQIEVLYADTFAANEDESRLYERRGYREVGVIRRKEIALPAAVTPLPVRVPNG
jgi:GNAT superfamily N-acetyltransferase